MNILFRADSSSTLGTGHIMRDLVLVKKFPNNNIIFAVRSLSGNINHKIDEAGYKKTILETNSFEELNNLIQELSIDMIVIDNYDIDYTFEKRLKELNPNLKIFVFDDTYEKHYCDILLNQNIYAKKEQYEDLVPKHCELRCGSEYTLLRDEFIKAKEKKISKVANRKITIFIAMGGTDILNLNPKILDVLSSFHNIEVKIVTTVSNQHLEELKNLIQNKDWIELCVNCTKVAELMAQSDLAIITPSVTANEVYFMELPIIAIQVAENQKYMSDFFKYNNIAVMKEFNKKILKNYVEKEVPKFSSEVELVNFIDLTVDEKKMVLEWRNNPEIRKWMFTEDKISLEEHCTYIESLNKRDDRLYFLVFENNEPIGVIDFTQIVKQESLHIGLYSNPLLFGKGKILMQKIIDYSFNTLKVKKIYSEVFEKNEKAYKLYKKFNFKDISKKTINNRQLIYMELNNEDR